jgi:O-antigen/teichoic acid export membrane protein
LPAYSARKIGNFLNTVASTAFPGSQPLNSDLCAAAEARRQSCATTGLPELAKKGGLYLTFRYGLSVLVGLGNMLVMTWWIGPHAYGIFVTAVGLTAFLASLARFGVDTYLIRCEIRPQPREYDVAFTLVLANSVLVILGGTAAVPLLGRWFSQTEFALPYLVLLATVPVTALAGIPIAKLERELNFREVAGIELAGQFSAFVLALVLALCGFGVWAPVAGMVAWQVVVFLLAWHLACFSTSLAWDAASARKMLAFGFGFSLSLRAWQLRTLINPLLVGRVAAPEAVAFVALAIRIADALGFVRTAAGRLALAGLAKLQSDPQRFRTALEEGIRLQVLSLGPLLCAFAVAGPWLVPRLMGPRWTPALAVFPLIAIGVLVNSVFNLQASALFVLGHQWTVVWAYASHVLFLAAGTFLLLPRLGILGYGCAELAACTAYFFIPVKLSHIAAISYRKLLPWFAAFSLPLVLEALG